MICSHNPHLTLIGFEFMFYSRRISHSVDRMERRKDFSVKRKNFGIGHTQTHQTDTMLTFHAIYGLGSCLIWSGEDYESMLSLESCWIQNWSRLQRTSPYRMPYNSITSNHFISPRYFGTISLTCVHRLRELSVEHIQNLFHLFVGLLALNFSELKLHQRSEWSSVEYYVASKKL